MKSGPIPVLPREVPTDGRGGRGGGIAGNEKMDKGGQGGRDPAPGGLPARHKGGGEDNRSERAREGAKGGDGDAKKTGTRPENGGGLLTFLLTEPVNLTGPPRAWRTGAEREAGARGARARTETGRGAE